MAVEVSLRIRVYANAQSRRRKWRVLIELFLGSRTHAAARECVARQAFGARTVEVREKENLMGSDTLFLNSPETAHSHLLRFVSLHNRGRGVAVPCDEAGNVDIGTLTGRLRDAYLDARAMVGREYSCPTVQIAF